MVGLKFKPVYGFGWFKTGDNRSIGVPEEFCLEVASDEGDILRGVISHSHPMEGMVVELAVRTQSGNAISYNVKAFDPAGVLKITGFAERS